MSFSVNFTKFLRTPFLQNTFWRLILIVLSKQNDYLGKNIAKANTKIKYFGLAKLRQLTTGNGNFAGYKDYLWLFISYLHLGQRNQLKWYWTYLAPRVTEFDLSHSFTRRKEYIKLTSFILIQTLTLLINARNIVIHKHQSK